MKYAACEGKRGRKIQSSEERQAGPRNSADAEEWIPNKDWAETANYPQISTGVRRFDPE
jgi:hypothetical protein